MIKLKSNRIFVFLLTLGLLAVAAAIYVVDEYRLSLHPCLVVWEDCTFEVSSLKDTSSAEPCQVEVWQEATEGKYYLFVPAYSDLKHTVLNLTKGIRMYIDGKELKSGDDLSAFAYDTEYSLLLSNMNDEMSLTIVKTGGVATLYLDTASGSMDYLSDSQQNEESGNMTIITENGDEDYSGKVSNIRGHGNSSWKRTQKKPLSLKLSSKADLLGMGESRKWVLINNYNEVTNLNNKLIYEFADDVGLDYSPDCELVDTYINGVYYGVYLLSEKNEIAENRVDVEEPTNQAGGSYLVDMTYVARAKKKNENYVLTKEGYCLRIISPGDVSSEMTEEIRSDFQSLENALYSEDGIDPDTGKSWDQMIDLDSWVRKYLVEEIFNSVDTGKLSQYFYKTGKAGDDKIYAGPVWDYNSAMGNSHTDKPIQNPACLRAARERVGELHNWYYCLYHQEKFYNRMLEIYKEEFLPVLNEMLTEKMPALSAKISDSSHANLIRWKINVANYTSSSVEDEYQIEHKFLEDRIAYLNDDWLNGVDYSYISIRNKKSGWIAYYAIPTGQVFTEDSIEDKIKKVSKKNFVGWYDRATGELYDFSQPLTKEYLNLDGKWE